MTIIKMEKIDKKLEEVENQLVEKYGIVAGVDEVGRGCLAGPVVAAAVVLPTDCKIEGIKDSKSITQKKREKQPRWM